MIPRNNSRPFSGHYRRGPCSYAVATPLARRLPLWRCLERNLTVSRSGSRISWPISGTGVSRLISWPGVSMPPLVVPTSSSMQDTTRRFPRESVRHPGLLVSLSPFARRVPAGGLADRSFAMLQADPRHPSLRLKKAGDFWSARIGVRVRALAKDRPEGLVWFWIGPARSLRRIDSAMTDIEPRIALYVRFQPVCHTGVSVVRKALQCLPLFSVRPPAVRARSGIATWHVGKASGDARPSARIGTTFSATRP